MSPEMEGRVHGSQPRLNRPLAVGSLSKEGFLRADLKEVLVELETAVQSEGMMGFSKSIDRDKATLEIQTGSGLVFEIIITRKKEEN